MSDAVVALLGAVVGGAITATSSWIIQSREHRQRSELEARASRERIEALKEELDARRLDRETHRRAFVLSKAIECSIEQRRFSLELVKGQPGSAYFLDAVSGAEKYYRWINHLMQHGELHPEQVALEGGT